MLNRRQLIGAAPGVAVAGLIQANAAEAANTAVPPHLLAMAKQAISRHKTRIRNLDRIAIADFSTHSSKPRFHLIDLQTGKARSYLVAHGKGSDLAHTGWLKKFSNAPGSEATSQGAYLTADTYSGKHGHSRRLLGLDADNSNAYDRAIVIHKAWYVSDQMARAGAIGRSQGCFAFSEKDHASVMDLLGPERLILAVKA
jgi:hypothetical protein